MDTMVMLCIQDGAPEACEYYTLLGDPGTVIQLPTIKPATNLQAVASTGLTPQVSLSWTASPDAGVGYNVYRTTSLSAPYQKINASPVAGTNYADTAVINQTDYDYYYYVVAVKTGFESAWSNFNSDCSAGSPIDCVKARPLNLVPPSTPGTPVITDLETGGRLMVSWTGSPQPDIQTYEVHFGTTPAMNAPPVLSGVATTLNIGGLQDGTTYYFAVRARNSSGTYSALSGVATGVPTQVLGVKSPGFISTLRLAKSGINAVLTWTAVTKDIYGKPESVAKYEVYRGTTPTFTPTPANRIGSPTAPTHTDNGALGAGQPTFYYLVRAIDAEGNPSGLGQQLPDGVRALKIGKALNGNMTFSWPAVTHDFDGHPTTILRYDLYSADHPFTRADIRNGTIALLGSAFGTTLQIAPPSGSRYYSLVVVDTRGNLSPF
jgi:hypothetical protein